MSSRAETMEKIVALCRRRGFIFGSSEIYGGIGGFWDYGPLGTELKRNIKDAWWFDCVRNPPPGPNGIEYQMVGVDCSIIMNPKVWEASGHVGGFSDPMVDCKACNRRYRADQVWCIQMFKEGVFDRRHFDEGLKGESTLVAYSFKAPEISDGPGWLASALWDSPSEALESVEPLIRTAGKRAQLGSFKSFKVEEIAAVKSHHALFRGRDSGGTVYEGLVQPLTKGAIATNSTCPRPCPECFGELTNPREFNLMLQTHTGALQDSSSLTYLRPETAQGIFVNYKNVLDTSRVKVPFGIAQIGKAFRNEINPRNYTFRSREFEQYEIEFFCHPSEADMWYEYWRDLRYKWYVDLGLKSERLRLRDHEANELAHYAESCADVEYDFPFGISELEGIANRTDFDLKAHIEKSGKDLSYFDDQRKERYVPYVIEPSGGVDRTMLAVICEAYTVDEDRASPEFMNFHPRLAPIKAAVFPLVAKDGLPDIAEPIYRKIKKVFPCQYDAKQSIGKRYARMDEAGTPFCFTIDGQTKEDGTVTVRDRNDASQIRIDKSRCLQYLHDQLNI